MQADDLLQMMGRNLLDDPSQEAGYRALCRLGLEKPFECVGSVEESRAAMLELGKREGWKDKAIPGLLAAELASLDVPDLDDLLQMRGQHCIPDTVLQNVAF